MGHCPVCNKDVPAVAVEGKLVCANIEAAHDKHFLYQPVSVFRSEAERKKFLAEIERSKPLRRRILLRD